MKKGNIYEGIVEEIQFPNKGIVTYTEDGDTNRITVKGTLPGQKIEYRLTKKRKGKCEGRLMNVITASELEDRKPPCMHFGMCGGCTYQSMGYENQLKLKSELVKKLLDSVCSDYEYEGIIGSPQEFGYRNKMEFSFGDEYMNGPLALGMHKKDSFYDIVTTSECLIVNEDYNKVLCTVLDFFKENCTKYFHKMRHQGYLRHLLVRRAVTTGEMTVNIVTSTQDDMNLAPLTDRLLKLELNGKISGITHIYNDSAADAVKCDRMEILYGQDFLYEEILGLKFKVSTFSFFQTNSLGAEKLYEKAREYIGDVENKTVFDLYSGTGTIAQVLAPVADKVVGVEIVEEAVEAARENAALNNLDNCRFIAGDVLKVIDEIEEKPDLIVLDPPRDGINPKALKKIIDFGVPRMVYVSCKPTSLVRDLAVLQEAGYRVLKACAVDMFPQTTGIETVVKLSLNKDAYQKIK
ncbi:MAG: 23S rRNA (uracil(1939)-C(5))-methyltransferase RlmD [Lachnospiraceae bacterium]|nr:23S rRNA (uracil(1939)-C(5))-methyltransferase RlmD [Lachnospiraceae bacterium]